MSQKKDLIHNLTIRLPPSFPDEFRHERHSYEDDRGGITLCGIFLALSAYICEHFKELSDDQQRSFWEWIEWQTQSHDEDLAGTVLVCFMECIVDTDAETHSRPFMPESLVTWCDRYAYRGQRKKRWFERCDVWRRTIRNTSSFATPTRAIRSIAATQVLVQVGMLTIVCAQVMVSAALIANSRRNLLETVADLSSVERQRRYRDAVPYVHVPLELACQWDEYACLLHEQQWFRDSLTPAEFDAALAFDAAFNTFCDSLGRDLPEFDELWVNPGWAEIGRAAASTLEAFA